MTTWVKVFFSLTVLSLCGVTRATDRNGDQGWGAMLGNPSGLSWKMWMDGPMALDAAVGVDRGEIDFHGSILWHSFSWHDGMKQKPAILSKCLAEAEVPVYFGIGPRFLLADNVEFGVRFPVGVSYLPRSTPWEFFSEVAPVLRLTPDAGFNGDFAVGVRYYFPAIRARASK